MDEKIATRYETMLCLVTVEGVDLVHEVERIDQLGNVNVTRDSSSLSGKQVELDGPLHECILALDSVAREVGWHRSG